MPWQPFGRAAAAAGGGNDGYRVVEPEISIQRTARPSRVPPTPAAEMATAEPEPEPAADDRVLYVAELREIEVCDSAFAVCFHLRHCLCLVFPRPSCPRHCLCLVSQRPSRLSAFAVCFHLPSRRKTVPFRAVGVAGRPVERAVRHHSGGAAHPGRGEPLPLPCVSTVFAAKAHRLCLVVLQQGMLSNVRGQLAELGQTPETDGPAPTEPPASKKKDASYELYARAMAALAPGGKEMHPSR